VITTRAKLIEWRDGLMTRSASVVAELTVREEDLAEVQPPASAEWEAVGDNFTQGPISDRLHLRDDRTDDGRLRLVLPWRL